MQASERFISRFVFGKARIVNDLKRRLGSDWQFPFTFPGRGDC